MTSLPQFSPKQTSNDLHPPALFGGTANQFASLLRATKPTRIRMLLTPATAKHWLETTNVKNRPLSDKLVVFGEVGLAGEVRPVQRGQERLKEAAKLGFKQALIPAANAPKQATPGIEVHAVARIDEAVALVRG